MTPRTLRLYCQALQMSSRDLLVVAGARLGHHTLRHTHPPPHATSLPSRRPLPNRHSPRPQAATAALSTASSGSTGAQWRRAALAGRPQQQQRRGAGLVVRAERDFYQILGVSRDSDKKTIKSAYRQLARKFHPVGCWPTVRRGPNQPGCRRCMSSYINWLGCTHADGLCVEGYAWAGRPARGTKCNPEHSAVVLAGALSHTPAHTHPSSYTAAREQGAQRVYPVVPPTPSTHTHPLLVMCCRA